MDPLAPVCLLVRIDTDPQSPVFLGTCFAFRSTHRFLTAAHCVRGLEPSVTGIFSPKAQRLQLVSSISVHPTADVAVIEAVTPLRFDMEPFLDLVQGPHKIGADFVAYGFPEDVFGHTPPRLTQRLFKGHFQRFFPYKSHLGHEYLAGELSIGCPAGLSGGPVFNEFDDMYRVFGVVTENHESYTALDAVEELDSDGRCHRHTYTKVINYGVCAMLYDLQEWLATNAPTII